MTAQTRSVNKSRFEQGDTPQGSDYVDLIDSYLSLADVSAQSVSSPVSVAGALGASTTVSANTIEAQTVSASSASFETLTLAGETILPPSQAVATGEIFITATASFVASGAGSFSILPGTFSAISTLQVETSGSPTLAEIEYTGSATARFEAHANYSVKASANNKLSGLRIGVNASSLSRSQNRRLISSTTDIGSGSVD